MGLFVYTTDKLLYNIYIHINNDENIVLMFILSSSVFCENGILLCRQFITRPLRFAIIFCETAEIVMTHF